MIAEILLVLAGHSSTLFPTDHTIHPSFAPLLHPGELQCLNALGHIAFRYRKVKAASSKLARSPSRYICALCAKLNEILKDEYESLVIDTEAKVLSRDDSLVGRGSFVPLSSIRSTFSEWDNPLAALESLMDALCETTSWPAGALIDMLLVRSDTGIHRIASIMSRLAVAVQRVWRAELQAFIVHGSLSTKEPIASEAHVLHDDAIPACVTVQARESITYVGRAVGTVKAARWHKQMPSSIALEHTRMLDAVLPQDQHDFERVVFQIRVNVSEWLWLNVMTQKDVEDAVESLANYFLLRNGEFSLSLIREIERLKISRLTARSGPTTMIREQDLHLALLRASLGTSAQHDPSLTHLRFQLPSGPLRPLLPSLLNPKIPTLVSSVNGREKTNFDDILLGTHLNLSYAISWPLDLFLQTSDLATYAEIFAFLSSLRHIHTRIHSCWTSLSNAQRARRRWTGLGEGGTREDSAARRDLLRCGWGVVRIMTWFMDVLLGYMMIDVVEGEFRRLKEQLRPKGKSMPVGASSDTLPSLSSLSTLPTSTSQAFSVFGPMSATQYLDFTTLRKFHTSYLERLMSGCLLAQPALTATIRSVFEVCERFTAQVERWGGDVLPALLFEGSLAGGGTDKVGEMVKERWEIVKDINETLQSLLESFYQQLLLTTSQPFGVTDASKSMTMNATNTSMMLQMSLRARARGGEGESETRRLIERLLLRLDFNGGFSRPLLGERLGIDGEPILRPGS